MTILSTPALREYEQLILFVKPFCAFLFKMYKTIGFFLISYKYTIQILQTISSIIISYKQPLPSLRCVCIAGKGFFLSLLIFTGSFPVLQKIYICTGDMPEPFYAEPEQSFLKNKLYISA